MDYVHLRSEVVLDSSDLRATSPNKARYRTYLINHTCRGEVPGLSPDDQIQTVVG